MNIKLDNFGLININRLYNKLFDIKQILHSYKLKVLCVTETWLNSSIKNDEVNLHSYKIFHLDRDKGHGGGLCV